jgi:NADP-dependent aldehyde dehydrogenase
MELHGQNFIGDTLSRGSGEPFVIISPLDQVPLAGTFHPASSDDIDAALKLADAAFAVFSRTAGEKRAELLERIADEILAVGDALLQRAHLETALPIVRLTNERARTTNQLRMFAALVREGSWVDARIDPAQPTRQPLPRADLRRMLLPLGPVVVFGASNFPFAYSVAGGDTASALATGNPVIVKAHERHPGTSELVAGAVQRALAAANLPAGVFSMLHGGPATATALVKHPLARAVGFTGSRAAGRALFDVAAARPSPIPVFAEMSSLNPVFLLPGAVQERGAAIAEGLNNSVTLGAGQFCTKPGLVFAVDGPDFAAFCAKFGALFAEVQPTSMLHQGICANFQRGLDRLAAHADLRPLARSGGVADATKTQALPTAYRIDAANFLKDPHLQEELFGPYTLFVTAKSLDEFETLARHLDGQLTASVHGTPADLASAKPLLALLERTAGRLVINGFPTGVEVCPAMNHGGPYPATTDSRFTSVGTAALERFVRPVCYQDFPETLLPAALRNENPLKLWRLVDGRLNQAPVG